LSLLRHESYLYERETKWFHKSWIDKNSLQDKATTELLLLAVQMLQGESRCVTVWTPIRQYGRVMLMVYGLCRYKERSNLHGDRFSFSDRKDSKKENREDIALDTLSTMSCCPVSSLPRLIPFLFFFFLGEKQALC
jgi:hypothetical protein